MMTTDRIEIIGAAHFAGPGLSRWQPLIVRVIGFSENKDYKFVAVAEHGRGYAWRQPNPIWKCSFIMNSRDAVAAKIKSIITDPSEFHAEGKWIKEAQNSGKIAELFKMLVVETVVDVSLEYDTTNPREISIGAGQFLARTLELDISKVDQIAEPLAHYLANAPFTYGYWAPFKRIYKLIEAGGNAPQLMGIALARIDAHLEKPSGALVKDDISRFHSFFNSNVASRDTLEYLARRGRRYFRTMASNNRAAYAQNALSFLRAVDEQGANTPLANRWILADLLYGRTARQSGHGHGSVKLPASRYDRRWDRYPKVWDQHLTEIKALWKNVQKNQDVQAWCFNVLKSKRQEIPQLPEQGLSLALLSKAKKVRAFACTQVTSGPMMFLKLDRPAAIACLEFLTDRQFKKIYPTIVSAATNPLVQDAIWEFSSSRGLNDVLSGRAPQNLTSRTDILLGHVFCHMQMRTKPAQLYNLAYYVGQTTNFLPIKKWADPLRAMPLEALVELRLNLRNLSPAVRKVMDNACRATAKSGFRDEKLGIALAQSPTADLRELGWSLLTGASSQAIAQTWDMLLSHAETPDGMARLLEAITIKDRLATLKDHPDECVYMALLMRAAPQISQRLFDHIFSIYLSLAPVDNALELLDQLLGERVDWTDKYRLKLVKKAIDSNFDAYKAVWSAVPTNRLENLRAAIKGSKSIVTGLIENVESGAIISFSEVQSNYLADLLGEVPSRIVRDTTFGVAAATSPNPGLHQLALAFLESRNQLRKVFVQLLESGLPAAAQASERYIKSIKEKKSLTAALIAGVDSGVFSARSISLHLLRDRFGDLDAGIVLTQLSEHKSPDVAAFVAAEVIKGKVRHVNLTHFDEQILRSRGTARKAKELVKSRIDSTVDKCSNNISHDDAPDTKRIETLLALARSKFQRDREWALQQLTKLALDGHEISGLTASRLS
ncbi:MAG: hypothetical protein ABJX32_04765 [Tateyamaria sp.]|uniref:hypothetical protein n=1 Tax=Tateyamaria sp. TaxID=1929288 RepID=UPI00329CCB8F